MEPGVGTARQTFVIIATSHPIVATATARQTPTAIAEWWAIRLPVASALTHRLAQRPRSPERLHHRRGDENLTCAESSIVSLRAGPSREGPKSPESASTQARASLNRTHHHPFTSNSIIRPAPRDGDRTPESSTELREPSTRELHPALSRAHEVRRSVPSRVPGCALAQPRGQICHTDEQQAYMDGGNTDVGSSSRRHRGVTVSAAELSSVDSSSSSTVSADMRRFRSNKNNDLGADQCDCLLKCSGK